MSNQLEIKLPESIANWIFDLHDATRRSLRSEVQPLYEEQYKELTDKFFTVGLACDQASGSRMRP